MRIFWLQNLQWYLSRTPAALLKASWLHTNRGIKMFIPIFVVFALEVKNGILSLIGALARTLQKNVSISFEMMWILTTKNEKWNIFMNVYKV